MKGGRKVHAQEYRSGMLGVACARRVHGVHLEQVRGEGEITR